MKRIIAAIAVFALALLAIVRVSAETPRELVGQTSTLSFESFPNGIMGGTGSLGIDAGIAPSQSFTIPTGSVYFETVRGHKVAKTVSYNLEWLSTICDGSYGSISFPNPVLPWESETSNITSAVATDNTAQGYPQLLTITFEGVVKATGQKYTGTGVFHFVYAERTETFGGKAYPYYEQFVAQGDLEATYQ
jgi:hypothetical protein